jgi:uncharacterized RDD family membrane protein YckC
MALLAGLFVIIAVAVGRTTFGPGVSFSFWLSLTWWPVYLALLLGYYFTMETLTGQTVGKALAGLRVVRADGSRPSAGAIAARTLLRIIDWLPFLYLAGFITMLATGQRRKRLGDLAAGTVVARSLPARRRGLLLIPLALILAAAAGLSAHRAASPAGTQTYQAHGVSFDYPPGWREGKLHGTAAVGSNALWNIVIGIGRSDLILVIARPLNRPVTAANLGEIMPALVRDVRGGFEQEGGVLQAGPAKITVGGMPAVEFRGTGQSSFGTAVGRTLVLAFRGTTYYQFNCQHTRAHAAEVERACNQVVRTFKVG